MPPRGQKPLLNPAAAEFVPGQSSQPTTAPATSDTTTGRGSMPARGTPARLNPPQSTRSGASATSFHVPGRDPTYFENPNPAFLRAPRLIPGRSTGRSVMEERAHAYAAGPDPDEIPLYGSLHGMSYHPSTRQFTGDGPPRSTPLRDDGKAPCTPAMMAPRNPTAYGKVITDQLHIQTKSFVEKASKGFGANGNVRLQYLGKPEPRIVQREEDEEQYENMAAAKENLKRKIEEDQKWSIEKAKEEEEHFRIVTGAQPGSKEKAAGKEREVVRDAGPQIGAGEFDGVIVRDFAYDPIKEKKNVYFKSSKKALAMAEKLQKQFAQGL